jgi:hypothetical protein
VQKSGVQNRTAALPRADNWSPRKVYSAPVLVPVIRHWPELLTPDSQFVSKPGQGSKIIVLPAAISGFQPKKPTNADRHNADIKNVVDGKNDEVIGKDQRNMNQRANAEDHEMHHHTDFRRTPSPKPIGASILFEVNPLNSIRGSRDFRRTGIRKFSKNPGV